MSICVKENQSNSSKTTIWNEKFMQRGGQQGGYLFSIILEYFSYDIFQGKKAMTSLAVYLYSFH